MPKQKTTKDLTYNERLIFWSAGECPYCESNQVTVTNTRRGGKHYACHSYGCKAENHFSKGIKVNA